MPKKWHWDASAVLSLSPQSCIHLGYDNGKDYTCVGFKGGSMQRCRVRRGERFRTNAAGMLVSLGRVDPRSKEAADLLLRIADEMLCRFHGDQAEDKQEEWLTLLDLLNVDACRLRADSKARAAQIPAVLARRPAYKLSGRALWDPFLTMKLNLSDQSPCIGFAISSGRGCGRPVARATIASAISALEVLSQLDPQSSGVRRQLPAIAKQLLCLNDHQYQYEEVVERWGNLIATLPGAVKVKVKTEDTLFAEYTDIALNRQAPKSTHTAREPKAALPTTPASTGSASVFGLSTPPASADRALEETLSKVPVTPKKVSVTPAKTPVTPDKTPIGDLASPSSFIKKDIEDAPQGGPKPRQKLASELPSPPSSPPKADSSQRNSKKADAPSDPFNINLPTPPSTDPNTRRVKVLEEPASTSFPVVFAAPISTPTPAPKAMQSGPFMAAIPSSSAFTFRALPPTPPKQQRLRPVPKVRLPPPKAASLLEPSVQTADDAAPSKGDAVPAINEESIGMAGSVHTAGEEIESSPAPDPHGSPSPISPPDVRSPEAEAEAEPDTNNEDKNPPHLRWRTSTPPPITSPMAVDEHEEEVAATPYTPTRKPTRTASPVATEEPVACDVPLISEEAAPIIIVHADYGEATIFTTSYYTRPASSHADIQETQQPPRPPREPPQAHIPVERKPVASHLPAPKWESITLESLPSPDSGLAGTPDMREDQVGIEDATTGSRARAKRRGWRWLRGLFCIPSARGGGRSANGWDRGDG